MKPLPKAEFDQIYAKVPRLTVEIIVKNKSGEIFLTKRAIEPCRGQWHLPGGTVFLREPLIAAVRRVAERELGIKLVRAEIVGVIEYPSHYLHGLDHPVGIVFETKSYHGSLRPNHEAMDTGWFNRAPEQLHADQDVFLLNHSYLHS